MTDSSAGRPLLLPEEQVLERIAEALRVVGRRLAAAQYVSLGGLPWVGREGMFAAVNDTAREMLGEGWVALMRNERIELPDVSETTCPICSAVGCHCATCSMIVNGDVPESYGMAHVAAVHGSTE